VSQVASQVVYGIGNRLKKVKIVALCSLKGVSMSERKTTYKCKSCGERFKLSMYLEAPKVIPVCPQCGTSNGQTVVPAYQYGSWGGPMAPELPKAYFG